jgi:hypothetical protein
VRTAITEMFGIEHPIIQGGMHYVGFAELAAGGVECRRARTHHRPDATDLSERRGGGSKDLGLQMADGARQ